MPRQVYDNFLQNPSDLFTNHAQPFYGDGPERRCMNIELSSVDTPSTKYNIMLNKNVLGASSLVAQPFPRECMPPLLRQ